MIESFDWNEAWKERMMNATKSRGGKDCVGIWNNYEEARNYRKMIGELEEEPLGIFRENMILSPTFKVLDIGAGTGRLAVPFARISSKVTAVEPAAQMRDALLEEIKRNNIKNIDCVPKRWEDVNVQDDLQTPYDLVVASFSLGFSDLKDALIKMVEVSSKYICLMWFAGDTSWDTDLNKITSALYGKINDQSMPKSDILFNVLYQMGIYPSIKVFDFELLRSFGSLDEATACFADKFSATSAAQRSVLKGVLPQILNEKNGQWILSSHARNMMFWWEKIHD